MSKEAIDLMKECADLRQRLEKAEAILKEIQSRLDEDSVCVAMTAKELIEEYFNIQDK